MRSIIAVLAVICFAAMAQATPAKVINPIFVGLIANLFWGGAQAGLFFGALSELGRLRNLKNSKSEK